MLNDMQLKKSSTQNPQFRFFFWRNCQIKLPPTFHLTHIQYYHHYQVSDGLGCSKRNFSPLKKNKESLSFLLPLPPPHSPSQTPNSTQHFFNRFIIIKTSLFWLLPRPLTQSIVHEIGLKNFKRILRVTDQYILENAMTQYGRLTGAIREYT